MYHAEFKAGVYCDCEGNTYHALGMAENTDTHELTVIFIPQQGPDAGKLLNRNLRAFLEQGEKSGNNSESKGLQCELSEKRHFLRDSTDFLRQSWVEAELSFQKMERGA